MKIILASARLFFREFTTDDAPLLLLLNSDPEVVKYVHELPLTDEATALGTLTKNILPQYAQNGFGRWAVHLKENNAFIGWCGLKFRPERDEIDLGYRFIRKYWGQGYASEAAKACIAFGFAQYHIPLLTAMAHIENTASLKVIEKCGFQFRQFEEVDSCPVKVYQLHNSTLS
ncbi:MAG: GNAT family N-acetyltransferase [Bacteroidota bacterium]